MLETFKQKLNTPTQSQFPSTKLPTSRHLPQRSKLTKAYCRPIDHSARQPSAQPNGLAEWPGPAGRSSGTACCTGQHHGSPRKDCKAEHDHTAECSPRSGRCWSNPPYFSYTYTSFQPRGSCPCASPSPPSAAIEHVAGHLPIPASIAAACPTCKCSASTLPDSATRAEWSGPQPRNACCKPWKCCSQSGRGLPPRHADGAGTAS